MFCGGPIHASGQAPLMKGIAVLVQEGILAWLKYRNSPDHAAGMGTGSHSRQPESMAFPKEELVILFATMIGGDLYEPEF